jgi:hypothetical protein
MKTFSISLGIALLFPFFSFSQVFVNATTGNDANDGLTVATAKQTINAGIATATVGQTVFIAAGTYAGCTLNKSVNLQGAGIGLTVIQGSGTGNGINVNTALSNVTISNLTITNFLIGINIQPGSVQTIANLTLNTISASSNVNYGLFAGGNANLDGLTITNSRFNNNSGVSFARGVWIMGAARSHANIVISNSEFNNNALVGFDLGLHTSLNNLSISACEFRNNGDAQLSFYEGHSSPANSQIFINNNIVEMGASARFGIEAKNTVGTGLATGNGRVVISDNRVFKTATGTDGRDAAGIAVICRREGTAAYPEPSGVVIINNNIEDILPGDGTCGTCGGNSGNGFGIVAGGNNHRILNNVVSGCQIGIQLQGGNINAGSAASSPSVNGNANTLYFDRDNSATCNGSIVRYNKIVAYGSKAIRNLQSVHFLPNDVIDYTGNWLGNAAFAVADVESYLVSDPAIASFTATPNTNAAFNPWAAVDLDDVPGGNSGQRGVQINSAKEYRATATQPTTSIGVIPQGILIANTAFKDVLDIRAGTYNITNDIIVDKRIHLLGHGGGMPRPDIVMLPAPAPVLSLFVVSAQNVTIENLYLKVLGSKTAPPPAVGVQGIFVSNHTTPLSYNNLEILNNFIENITPINLSQPVDVASFAIRFTVPTGSPGSGNNTVKIEGNTIFSAPTSNFFGRGIRSFGNNGIIQNNTITAALYGLQWGDITNGTLSVTNNTFNALYEAGVEINATAIDNVTHTVSNNTFNAVAPTTDFPFALLEFKNMAVGSGVNTIVNVNNNTFNGITQYGIFSGRSRNLNITNNTFTPNPAATNFYHVCLNTKHRTTGLAGAAITSENITIRGNTFHGNGIGGTGVFFANHHSGVVPAFNNITIGGAGAGEANNFHNNLTRFIALDPHFGTSNAATLALPLNPAAANPWANIWANPLSPVTATTMATTTSNFDAQNNNFDVGTGLKTPATMTNQELISLEDRISHKIDYAPLGFVTVKPNHIFVTQQSFIAPNFTTEPRIRRGTDVATADGFTLNVEGFTYTDVPGERPNTTFDMDFVPVITDPVNHPAVVSPHWEMNGAGKTLNLLGDLSISTQVIFNAGNIQTNANTLNFTPTAIDPVANPATVGEKNNSRILGRARTVRNVGLAAFDFLGLNLPAGANLGTLDLTRISGAAGIVTMPSGISIACTWLIQPSVANGRNNVSFRWLPAINNAKNVNQLQAWRNNGTEWEPRSDIFAATSTSPLIETIPIDITGFSPWTISDILNPLPVELLYIQAVINGKNVPEVQWATISERNVDYFEIERSLNAKDFVKIGSTKAKGNQSYTSYYNFEDSNYHFKSNLIVYYRLKEVSENGKFSYSRVVSLRKETEQAFIEKVYPNPTQGRFYVEMQPQSVVVHIQDIFGRTVQSVHIQEASNQIDISHLPKGVYLLNFEGENQKKTVKLVLH